MTNPQGSQDLIPREDDIRNEGENQALNFKDTAHGPSSEAKKIANRCGVLGCYPTSLRRLATPKIYFFCFCLQNVILGMMTAYLIGTQTSVERHFQFSAKTMGLFLTFGQVGPVFTSLFFAYFATKGNRPRWMCAALSTLGIAMLFSFSLKLIFPPPNLQSNQASVRNIITGNATQYSDLCVESVDVREEECTVDATRQNWGFVCWIVIYTMIGIGSTTMYAVSSSYLDDSVPKKDSPLYFGLNMAVRIVGPISGSFLGAACVKLYVKLNDNPGFARNDPRWIGAWWFGYAILAFIFFFIAAVFAWFPKEMNENSTRKKKQMPLGTIEDNHSDSGSEDKDVKVLPSKTSDLKQAILRVAKNPVLVCLCMDDVCGILGSVGFGIWLPKFLENEYRMSRSQASLVGGITNNGTMIVGILSFSIWIRKHKPKARIVALIISCAKFLYVLGAFSLMFMGCGYDSDLPGIPQPDGSLQLHTNCSQECSGGCATARFIPVCHESHNESQTYFSPCFAGCVDQGNSTSGMTYTGCKCLSSTSTWGNPSSDTVRSGYCNNKPCSKFYAYIVILGLMRLVISISPVGSMMIKLRCVEPRDKTMALGLMSFLTALLGFIPNPLIYGSLIDSSCLVWEESCGDRGACWVYNLTDFRYKLHGLAVVFIFLAACCQFATFWNAGNLELVKEDEDGDGEETQDLNAK